MLRCFLILAAVCLVFPVRAQNESGEINVVIFAPHAKETHTPVRLPSCNEAPMLAKVADAIKEYQDAHPGNSIVSRRKQALMIKNLKGFEEIPVADFDNSSNYEVARELVMTKVNYRIEEKNLRLCRGNSDIYLLIYPEGHGFRVQILNFIPAVESGNEFSVFYVPAASEKMENRKDQSPTAKEMTAAPSAVDSAEPPASTQNEPAPSAVDSAEPPASTQNEPAQKD